MLAAKGANVGVPVLLKQIVDGLSIRPGDPTALLVVPVGLLVASEALAPEAIAGVGFIGELGLDGTIHSVEGAVPLLDAVDADPVVVPLGNTIEAQVVGRQGIRSASTLRELVDHFEGKRLNSPNCLRLSIGVTSKGLELLISIIIVSPWTWRRKVLILALVSDREGNCAGCFYEIAGTSPDGLLIMVAI